MGKQRLESLVEPRSVALACLIVLLLMVVVVCGLSRVLERCIIIHALAVSGNTGEVINIDVLMLHPGDGRVYVAASPLPYGSSGTLFITSSQLAMYIASTIAGVNPDNYSFLIRPQSTLIMIGGPSASAYITCAMYALLTNSTFRENITMTGMILPGGIIGPVGGVPLKIEAAAREGFREVLVPAFNYLALSPDEIPENVRVIPVVDVYHAIEYFTGKHILYTNITLSSIRKITTFRVITKYLWDLIYYRFNHTINLASIPPEDREAVLNLYNEAIELANKGDYYTAASTLYRALIKYYIAYTNVEVSRRGIQYLYALREDVTNMLRDVETRLQKYTELKLNPLSVDLIVGIYDRVEIAKELLREFDTSMASGDLSKAVELIAEARARTETLYDWLKVLSRVQAETTISMRTISKLSRLYIEFLKSLLGYSELVETYGLERMASKIQDLEELYRSGHYLKALGLSFTYSSEITGDIVQYYVTLIASQSSLRASELIKFAKPLRQVILSELWSLSKSNLTSVFAYMYLEYGDYYLSEARSDLQRMDMSSFSTHIALAYRFYTSALLHIMLLKSLAIEAGVKTFKIVIAKPSEEVPQSTVNKSSVTSISLPSPEEIKFYLEPSSLLLYVMLLVVVIVVFCIVLLVGRRSYIKPREET